MMAPEPAVPFPWRLLVLFTALVGVGLAIMFWPVIANRTFPDPDDHLRLLQIRDYLGGQGWFDLTQRRINPPDGLPMHWSRLVDIPILVFLVPLTPLIGSHAAETFGLIAAPLLNLFALLGFVTVIVRRLFPRSVELAPLGWALTVSSLAILAQIHPGRIDHHGWQFALAAGAIMAVLDDRPQRSGILAGLFCGLFLAVSLEALPFVVSTAGILALLWVFFLDDSGQRLARFVQSLALTSVVVNLLVAPTTRWSEGQCDALGPGHLVGIVVGAVAITIATRLGKRHQNPVRLGLIAAAAIAAIVALGLVRPQCLQDPFATLDPLVRRLWYLRIAEGQPVWTQSPVEAMVFAAAPLLWFTGIIVRLRQPLSHQARRQWFAVLLFAFASILVAAFVVRASGVAHIAALPGAIVLIRYGLEKLEHLKSLAPSVLAKSALILLLCPLTAPLAISLFEPSPASATAAGQSKCDDFCAISRLNQLPATTLLANVDLGPIILSRTHHSVFAAGYHRLQAPLAASFGVFMGDDSNALAFFRKTGIRYVLIATDNNEMTFYTRGSPKGFASRVMRGERPSWLRPVPYSPSRTLLLFEVVQP